MKKQYKKTSKKDLEEFDAQYRAYRAGFDEMYNASTIASKSLKDTKQKTDIMQKEREQTALLKKRNKKKNLRIKHIRD